MTVTVKRRDIYPITFTANMDLTGSTVRLLARKRFTADAATELASTFAGAVVTHILTGDLDVGSYDIELEVTRDGEVVTFPTGDGPAAYETLTVVEDLG